MMSQFRIRIEDVVNGRIALLVPGSKGEHDMVEAVVAAILSRGVGVLKTETQVERAIRDGLHDVLMKLKREVVPS